MTYYNRDNLFNYNPIQRGVQGNVGQKGVTGERGDEWELFSSENYLPENTGYTNLPGLTLQGVGNAGGALFNNKIYFARGGLVVDTIGDTIYRPPGLTGIPGTYTGAILATNNKIYCIPASGTTTICIIDPLGETFDTKTMTGVKNNGNAEQYISGVLAPNGKIYCVPYNNPDVLVIDPIGNSFYYPIGMTGLSDNQKYQGGALGTNGRIYCIPFKATNVLEIDPTTDTMKTNIIGMTNIIGTSKYIGGVLAPNGLIYCMPRLGTVNNVGVIDPIGQTFYTIFNGLIQGSYIGGVLAQNGLIYCCPSDTNKNIMVIDPIENKLYTNLKGLTNLQSTYAGGVLAPNGSIYLSPNWVTPNSIIKVTTGLPKYPPWMLDPYFNKF